MLSILITSIGVLFADIAVKPTISLKNIVTASKASAGTDLWARSLLNTGIGSILESNTSLFCFSAAIFRVLSSIELVNTYKIIYMSEAIMVDIIASYATLLGNMNNVSLLIFST